VVDQQFPAREGCAITPARMTKPGLVMSENMPLQPLSSKRCGDRNVYREADHKVSVAQMIEPMTGRITGRMTIAGTGPIPACTNGRFVFVCQQISAHALKKV
jgi:hypothetical protein